MTAKKKRTTLAICLATGVCVFSSAVLANYSTSNGYGVYKNAIKGLLGMENYTLDVEAQYSFDGEVQEDTHFTEKYNIDGDTVRSTIEEDSNGFKHSEYIQDKKEYDLYEYGDGSTSARVYNIDEEYYPVRAGGRLGGIDAEKDAQMIRFAELLTDTLVGDLKNNFIYVEGDDTHSSYEIKLDALQIPELINAGISAMLGTEFNSAMENNYDPDEFIEALHSEPAVKSASCEFTVDNEGRLTYNRLYGSIVGADSKGNKHTMEIEVTIKISDYGTTTPDKLDISTLPKDTLYYNDETYEFTYMDGSPVVYDEEADEDDKYTVDAENGTYTIKNEKGEIVVEYNAETNTVITE